MKFLILLLIGSVVVGLLALMVRDIRRDMRATPEDRKRSFMLEMERRARDWPLDDDNDPPQTMR